MECLLILKGSYKDNFVSKEDVQLIKLHVNPNKKLSFNHKIIENAWYTARLQLIGFNAYAEEIDIEFYINDELLDCRQEYIHYLSDNTIEIDLLFSDAKIKQLFLLNYDLVNIKINICLDENRVTLQSDYLACVSRNVVDYRNIEEMIGDILDFEDSEIMEWIYNQKTDTYYSDNEAYGLLQGAYKKDAHKSIYSFVQLLKEIYDAYYRNIFLFKSQPKHNIIGCEKVIPYSNVKTLGNKEFDWLMHNADQLSVVSVDSAFTYRGSSYLPYKMRADEMVRNKDIYENRVVLSFLKTIVLKLTQIYKSYSTELIHEKEVIEKLHSLERDGFFLPVIIVKTNQLKRGDNLLKELNYLSNMFAKLLKIYDEILECKKTRLEKIPQMTKIFKSVMHYRKIYEMIIKWYRYGEFSLHKEELLLKIKKIDQIFEYYSLMHLLKAAKDRGYQLREQPGATYFYPYEVKDIRYKKVYEVNNTYSLINGVYELTLYYQPVIFSQASDNCNNISLFRTDKDSYWTPDFLFKMRNSALDTVHYGIVDSKYSSRGNIRNIYMNKELIKYICSIADSTGEVPSVRFMWLLQGRDYAGAQMENFHKSTQAKAVKPIPSYGIYTLNPTNMNMTKLWNELIRCLN